MIQVRVSDDFMVDGLAIWVSLKPDGGRLILRLHEDGGHTWEMVEPLAEVRPTLRLPEEAARALLDMLLRHYQGASDMHTVRSDLLHERGRVDKLLAAVTELAARPQTIHLTRAGQ